MTDHDHLDAIQQRIDAINVELQRLEDVRHAMTTLGKFTVLSVQRYEHGYKVRIVPVTWGNDTVVRHVENAGYTCAAYGTDDGGMYVNVGEK
jgi:hypothetical protein